MSQIILARLARLETLREAACLANDRKLIAELDSELFAIRASVAR